MSTETQSGDEIGEVMKVARTGKIGRVLQVDEEWGRLFPHKGPMVVLDIDSSRSCYSRCELDYPDPDFGRPADLPVEFH